MSTGNILGKENVRGEHWPLVCMRADKGLAHVDACCVGPRQGHNSMYTKECKSLILAVRHTCTHCCHTHLPSTDIMAAVSLDRSSVSLVSKKSANSCASRVAAGENCGNRNMSDETMHRPLHARKKDHARTGVPACVLLKNKKARKNTSYRLCTPAKKPASQRIQTRPKLIIRFQEIAKTYRMRR